MKRYWMMAVLIVLVPRIGVAGTDTSIYLGVDLSYVNEMEDCGGEYRRDGEVVDPFQLFSEAGATLVRVRLWHTPTWTAYSTLEDVKKTITRAKALGMAVLLDFHYSDTWADPAHQTIPAAWAEIEDKNELAQAVYDYTFNVLSALDQEGLLPDMVQVGNEINTEILRGEDESGYPINWERNAPLLNAGIRAVRDAGPQVVLHIAQPQEVEGWLLAAERAGVTDFDIIGISYYVGWSDYSVESVGNLVNKLRHQFQKEIIIAETAYPWTMAAVNESAGNILGSDFVLSDYSATPSGQKQFLVDLTQAVLANGGLGIVYWEPAWISTSCRTLWGQGSHWENATFFDFQHDNEVHEGIEFLSYPYELPVEITFELTVDQPMEAMYFWGDFTGSGRRLLPMQMVDDQTFVFSTRLMAGRTIEYAFYSGPNRTEDGESACVGDESNTQTWTVPLSDAEIVHVFGQCN